MSISQSLLVGKETMQYLRMNICFLGGLCHRPIGLNGMLKVKLSVNLQYIMM